MATNLNIDDVTYELKEDTNIQPLHSKDANYAKRFYIRTGFPLSYLTDNMTKREANKVAKSLRQLGFTVIDKTKEVKG